ncbi:PHP-associated domain-containing protein [Desulfotomaculum copahuensis]|uniref:PHP-associated domain-containing protein n=1 Tax=Desulfotomaculum copahuensis TaxID=1838280 RepID=UPI0012444B91|nr:PHP domain-containing protein [Desulfotomaculum copahuensis]
MHYLKAEFHCHVKLFSRRPFRPGQLRRRLEWARRTGLDVLAVTEHIDVSDFWEIYHCLESWCGHASGMFEWRGLIVLAGAEVSVAEGGDIIMIGSPAALKELEKRLGRLRPGRFPAFQTLMDASEDLGFLRTGAHPCRSSKELWKMGPLLKRLDALEVNATELSLAGHVLRKSAELNRPVLAGSDAHHWLQMGRVYNLLPFEGRFTLVELKQAVAQHRVTWQRNGVRSLLGKMIFPGWFSGFAGRPTP